MSKSGDMNFAVGRNYQQGKRNTGRSSFNGASGFRRRMGFSKRRSIVPFMNLKVMDAAVGRGLKKRLIQEGEQKVIETAVTDGAVSLTNVLNLLNGIQLGSTTGTRVGSKVRITKIQVLGDLRLSTTATNGLDRGKMTLFIDKQTNGAAPLYSTDTDLSSLYTPANYPFFKTNAYEDAFYIIKELDWILEANYSGQQNAFVFKWDIPINRVVKYNSGNAGTVADIVSNAVYFAYRGSIAAGAAASGISFRARVWYTDS